MLPVVARDLLEPFDDPGITGLDPELPAGVERPRREVHGADDRGNAVGEQHLSVQRQTFELADLDATVLKDTEAAHALHELLALACVRRFRHQVHLDAAARGAEQTVNDDHILESFVLHDQVFSGRLDQPADPPQPRVLTVQFQNIASNDISEFKRPDTQAVVYPSETASGSVIYPYANARR